MPSSLLLSQALDPPTATDLKGYEFPCRNKHIMIDLGTGNNNKINWPMTDKQEFIDIVEVLVSYQLIFPIHSHVKRPLPPPNFSKVSARGRALLL